MNSFVARVITGLGRGKTEFVPTVNLDLRDIPAGLEEGIYACQAGEDAQKLPAVMHYGPRPAIKEGPSCEVHFIDRDLQETPAALHVQLVARLRDVEDFDDIAALRAQIAADIAAARAILTSS